MNVHIPTGLYIFVTTYLTTRTLATVLNLFFWFKSPDDWASFVEHSPRMALAVRVSRAWGIDWRKVLRLARESTRRFRAQGLPLTEAVDVVVRVEIDVAPELKNVVDLKVSDR